MNYDDSKILFIYLLAMVYLMTNQIQGQRKIQLCISFKNQRDAFIVKFVQVDDFVVIRQLLPSGWSCLNVLGDNCRLSDDFFQ